ncbi:MAG: hypothetical protein ABSF38_06180 [Verrucomicrobiota bacterium]|jgi:hypothetical protein
METKSREKYLLIGVAVCVGLYLLNLIVISPMYAVWEARQKKIADLRKSIESGKVMVRRADLIEQRWNHMYVNTLSANPTAAESQLFRAFSGWAGSSGVVLVGQKPESKDSDDPDNYKNEEWRADVTGNVQQIERFLYAVESSPMGLKVEEVELNTRDDYGTQFALGLTVSGLILLNSPTNTTQ